jgi:hypothetical protein
MASSYVDPSARANSGGGSSARGGASFGNDIGRDGFVPNAELGEATARLVRAPADVDALDYGGNEEPCFACEFAKRKDKETDPFNGGEVSDAYDDMMSLVTENYGKGISNPELFRLVQAFYEREIRPLGDFPEWSTKSIARHFLVHANDEDVLMQEATAILYSQIQSVRSKTWIENTADGTIEPHSKNIILMEKLIRGLGDHLTKKKNRKTT